MAGVEVFPKEFGYVAFVLVAYCFLNFWMGFKVGSARKRYNVPYPTLYAIESENKDAKLFNCVQRGHQNSLEMMPVFFLLMVLGGIRHPCTCAALGSLFIVTRYFYFTGYSTGDPKNRLNIGFVPFPSFSQRLPYSILIEDVDQINKGMASMRLAHTSTNVLAIDCVENSLIRILLVWKLMLTISLHVQEIWVPGFVGAYGVHNFIRHQSSQRIVLFCYVLYFTCGYVLYLTCGFAFL
ncbi:unnamed protein product [Dovyalis caffra]|uniref:Glutathione S-transferase 3, mitochondrial n=1 Tax=Dovyalis caffra TaxID=77055 RepID=A0AAV1RTG5_9ROSI|nr:unnamed protein product [Dovyalis caffra]